MEGIGILLLFLSIVLLCILVPIWIIMGLAMNEENSKSIKKTYAITVPPVVIILLVAIILTVIGVKKYSSIPLSFVEDNKLTVLVEGTNSKGTSCDYYLSNEDILSKGKSKSYAGIPIGGVIIHKEGYVFENSGREGSDGIDGAEPDANKNQPVVHILYFANIKVVGSSVFTYIK